MPVRGAAIITKLTICHVILLPSNVQFIKSIVVQASSVLFFVLILFFSHINSFIPIICYLFCTDLLNLFTQIYLIAYNIKTSVGA